LALLMGDPRNLRLALVCILLATCDTAATAQPRPLVVNGNFSQHHPTTGALLVDVGGHLTGTCTGTLVGCDAFVTAAHCVCSGDISCTPNPAPYRVFLQHAGIFNVAGITVHPSYLFSEHNDIAVVTLSAPVTGISPAAINTGGSPPHGTAGTIVGFGVSKGTRDDSGIKRAGRVVTDSCNGQVPQSEHVCWHFDKPLGASGENSNTCFGDSGGPLFVDLGGGPVLAGVTSGGFNDTCLPTDLSFDTDVFANSAFVGANADLSKPTCGTISQVGDANTTVIIGGPAALNRATQKCRKEIGKHLSNYTRGKLGALHRCLDAVGEGSASGPCPDADTAVRIQRAVTRVDAARITAKCSGSVIDASELGGVCAGAGDAADLRACTLAVGDAVVAALLDREYADADPGGALPAEQAGCQKQIANTARQYFGGRLRALTSCRDSQDKGRVESCPHARAQTKLNRLASEVQENIERGCTNAHVAALDGAGTFGGTCAGASTTAALAACQIAEHNAQIDDILANVKSVPTLNRAAVEVPPGTDRLRVTVNGVDDGINDIDLFVRFALAPTTALFDASSTNAGVFDAIEVASPSVGTWHVLVHDYAGTDPDFQVTVTTFRP
jgi:hypothetical protein